MDHYTLSTCSSAKIKDFDSKSWFINVDFIPELLQIGFTEGIPKSNWTSWMIQMLRKIFKLAWLHICDVSRREFLALKWAVAKKFRSYLCGHKFHLVTDSNLLTYLTTSAKLSATDHRWLSSLAPFDFTITYRAEKVNGDADGLSCMPHPKDPDAKPVPDEDYIKPFLARISSSTEVACNFCSQETFQAICEYHRVSEPFNSEEFPEPMVETVRMFIQAVDHTIVGHHDSTPPTNWPCL